MHTSAAKKILVTACLAVLILGIYVASSKSIEAEPVLPDRILPNYAASRYKEIYLAGGCFWGTQAYFDRMVGVIYTNVGYANGASEQTDYSSIEATGHAETVYIVYNPEVLPLETLLTYYYGIIDPTVLNRQAYDVGTQYRTGIYYVDEADVEIINQVTAEEQTKYKAHIVTEIQPLKNYVLAEDYHQDYLTKNPWGYCHVDLSAIPNEKPHVAAEDYHKPSLEEIRRMLTPAQFAITQEDDTEYAFDNAYWDNDELGIYVDIVTGEPLFLSTDKFDSGCGWPSFSRPIQNDVITYNQDYSHLLARIEVRSRVGDSHLGHVFMDGLKEEGGLRYCINSGALEFIPYDAMEERGYGAFQALLQ